MTPVSHLEHGQRCSAGLWWWITALAASRSLCTCRAVGLPCTCARAMTSLAAVRATIAWSNGVFDVAWFDWRGSTLSRNFCWATRFCSRARLVAHGTQNRLRGVLVGRLHRGVLQTLAWFEPVIIACEVAG